MSTHASFAVPTGSGQLLGGTPWISAILEAYDQEWDDRLAEAVTQCLDWANEDLQSKAKRTKEWAAIADYLYVDWDGDGFVYRAQESVQERADALEYGDQDHRPTGFLRQMATKQAPQLSKKLINLFSDGKE